MRKNSPHSTEKTNASGIIKTIEFIGSALDDWGIALRKKVVLA